MPMIPAALHRTALRVAYPLALTLWRLTRPRVAGAYAVIRRAPGTPDEAWLFVTNTYKPGLTLPGGGIARGETPRAAARRETLEEVGLTFDETRFTAVDDFELEHLHRHDHVHFFEVVLSDDEPATPCADLREIAWAGFRRRSEIDPAELALPVRLHLARAGAAGTGGAD